MTRLVKIKLHTSCHWFYDFFFFVCACAWRTLFICRVQLEVNRQTKYEKKKNVWIKEVGRTAICKNYFAIRRFSTRCKLAKYQPFSVCNFFPVFPIRKIFAENKNYSSFVSIKQFFFFFDSEVRRKKNKRKEKVKQKYACLLLNDPGRSDRSDKQFCIAVFRSGDSGRDSQKLSNAVAGIKFQDPDHRRTSNI